MEFIKELQQTKLFDKFDQWLFSEGWLSELRYLEGNFWGAGFLIQQGILLEFLRVCKIEIEMHPKVYFDDKPTTYRFQIINSGDKPFVDTIYNDDYSTGLQEAILKSFGL